ncbi:DUF6332 family protein [Streptomyces sp. NPDC048389]|uniref:DUF6332 family protein n=1 Tax=Streptomyces sp. NPDC048389 TaxID=3154622 RepID=UPI0034553887
MERRTQADRDAVTIEISYALISAAVAAALVFGAVAGPKLMFTMGYAVERGLLIAGTAAGALVFVLRVATVLWRFGRGAARPGRPGHTSPGS